MNDKITYSYSLAPKSLPTFIATITKLLVFPFKTFACFVQSPMILHKNKNNNNSSNNNDDDNNCQFVYTQFSLKQ